MPTPKITGTPRAMTWLGATRRVFGVCWTGGWAEMVLSVLCFCWFQSSQEPPLRMCRVFFRVHCNLGSAHGIASLQQAEHGRHKDQEGDRSAEHRRGQQ